MTTHQRRARPIVLASGEPVGLLPPIGRKTALKIRFARQMQGHGRLTPSFREGEWLENRALERENPADLGSS